MFYSQQRINLVSFIRAFVIVTLLGDLILIVGCAIVSKPDKKHLKVEEQNIDDLSYSICERDMTSLQTLLELYYTHHKYYPKDLTVLIREGFITEKSSLDPWGNQYMYEPIYENGSSEAYNYLLASSGHDGTTGTTDDITAPINTERHDFKNKKLIIAPE